MTRGLSAPDLVTLQENQGSGLSDCSWGRGGEMKAALLRAVYMSACVLVLQFTVRAGWTLLCRCSTAFHWLIIRMWVRLEASSNFSVCHRSHKVHFKQQNNSNRSKQLDNKVRKQPAAFSSYSSEPDFSLWSWFEAKQNWMCCVSSGLSFRKCLATQTHQYYWWKCKGS